MRLKMCNQSNMYHFLTVQVANLTFTGPYLTPKTT